MSFQSRDEEIMAAVALMDKPARRTVNQQNVCCFGLAPQELPTRPFLVSEWQHVPVGSPVRLRGKARVQLIDGVYTEDGNPNWISVDGNWMSAIDLYVDYEYVSGRRIGALIDTSQEIEETPAPKPAHGSEKDYLPPGTFVQTLSLMRESRDWDKKSEAYLNRRSNAFGQVLELAGGTYMVNHKAAASVAIVAGYERSELVRVN